MLKEVRSLLDVGVLRVSIEAEGGMKVTEGTSCLHFAYEQPSTMYALLILLSYHRLPPDMSS